MSAAPLPPPALAQPPVLSGLSSSTGVGGGGNGSSAFGGGGRGFSLFAVVSEYMNRMLSADRTMKVLLVDAVTLPIISMSFSQTHLLNKGVFLVDSIAHSRQRRAMKALRCVFFIRADSDSVEAACAELRLAKYSNYTIVFCGAAGPELLDQLARADTEMLVSQVEEVFCDFCAVNTDAFLLETPLPSALIPSRVSSSQVRRIAEGLAALTVATRRRPLLRYQRNSVFARRVVQELEGIYKRDAELYNYRHKETTLLILDRSDDPATALLTPWTYQAMLHELVGLDHNKLRLPEELQGAEKEGYVFSEQDDLFYAANMFLNWGELCNNVKTYVDKCKAALNLDRSTATMEDIKQFMQKMPETKSLTSSVSKHATVVTYLSTLIKQRDLLQVSALEQDMTATDDLNGHLSRLQALAGSGGSTGSARASSQDILRLCLLFNLRYERAGQLSRTAAILDRMDSGATELLTRLREFYGNDRTTEGMFAETGVMAKIVKTFADTGNIYTQHQPVLRRTLMQCLSGRLDRAAYPYASGSSSTAEGFRPQHVIAYMCGGYTFEEAALVRGVTAGTVYKPAECAEFLPGATVVLGGETVLNTTQFIEKLR